MTDKTTEKSLATRMVFLLGAMSGLAPIATDMYLPAVIQMADDLSATPVEIQLTLAVFFMGFGFGQLIFGPLSDSLGRRPILVGGLFVFALASFTCAVTTSIDFLIVSRLFQALGGCAAAVSARAIVKDLTEGAETAKAISALIAIIQIGPLVAPLLGGLILLLTPWEGIFYVLVVYGALCLVVALFTIKESHPAQKRQSLHPKNILRGYTETLGNPNLVLLLAAEVCLAVGMLSFVTGSSLVLSEYYGLSAQAYGVIFAFLSLALFIGSFLNNRYVVKVGVNAVIKLCLSMGLISSILLVTMTTINPKLLWPFIALLWIALIPCTAARANYVALGMQYNPDRAGVVSGLFGAMSLGMAGVAAIGIGLFEEYTPWHMAMVLLVAYILSIIAYRFWYKRNN